MPLIFSGAGTITGINATDGLSSPQTGSVLQVVSANYNTETSTSSSTLTDTGLTATITPKFATSKILVTVHHTGCAKTTNNTYMFLNLLRGASIIAYMERGGGTTSSSTNIGYGTCSIEYLDSPATTSPTTYKTQYSSALNQGTIYLQTSTSSIPSTSTITLMEIAA